MTSNSPISRTVWNFPGVVRSRSILSWRHKASVLSGREPGLTSATNVHLLCSPFSAVTIPLKSNLDSISDLTWSRSKFSSPFFSCYNVPCCCGGFFCKDEMVLRLFCWCLAALACVQMHIPLCLPMLATISSCLSAEAHQHSGEPLAIAWQVHKRASQYRSPNKLLPNLAGFRSPDSLSTICICVSYQTNFWSRRSSKWLQ